MQQLGLTTACYRHLYKKDDSFFTNGANVPKKPPPDIITTHQGTTTAVQMSPIMGKKSPCLPQPMLHRQTNPKGRHQAPMALRPSCTGLRFRTGQNSLWNSAGKPSGPKAFPLTVQSQNCSEKKI